MSIGSFFAKVFWGSRWGLVDRFHRTPHKGLDIVHAGRTPVPALRTGRVVLDLPSTSVGRYIVVEVGPRDYDVYCHVVTRGIKSTIQAGQTLCYLAGYGDPHGTAWTGPHLHVCRSRTRTGWAFWGPDNRNPESLILSILTGALPTPKPKPHTISKETDIMRARSESSGTWYVIPEMAPPTAILTGKSGSTNHKHALAYNAALGTGFPVLPSEQIRALLDDNAARRIAFFKEQAAALGLSTTAIQNVIAKIQSDIETLKAQEPATVTPEAAALIAEQINADLAEGLAEAVRADIDGVVEELQATIPQATLAALAAKLGN